MASDAVKHARLGARRGPHASGGRVRPRTVIFLICLAAVLYTAHLALFRTGPSKGEPSEKPAHASEREAPEKPARPAEKPAQDRAAASGGERTGAQPQQQRGTDKEPGAVAVPGHAPAKPAPAPTADTGKGTAVVVIAYNRPQYLTRSLESILRPLPKTGFTVYVSQDGSVAEVTDVAKRYAARGVKHIQHIDTSPLDFEKPSHEQFRGYYLIARHYKWALTQLFDVHDYDRVIILEDDIEVASDFFEYFMATWPLLDQDPTLWAVSAFNDQGKPQHVKDPRQLYRSDFFPGLGWLMPRKLWRELGPIWPRGFWDDWMRRSDIRKGRVTIRPEISRSYTFGQEGASHGEFFDTHLRPIKLNAEHVPFTETDVSYLLKEPFDRQWVAWVSGAHKYADIAQMRRSPGGDARLEYGDHPTSYVPLARAFGLMEDEKDGVPRTAYMGVICFRDGPHRVFLTPHGWDAQALARGHHDGGAGRPG